MVVCGICIQVHVYMFTYNYSVPQKKDIIYLDVLRSSRLPVNPDSLRVVVSDSCVNILYNLIG